MRGFLLRYQGHREEAISILRKAAEAYPNASSVYYQLGVCLMELGRSAEAAPQVPPA